MGSVAHISKRHSRRNVIFFGEIGSGKSSVINLLLGANVAPVSNDSRPCTQASAFYELSLRGWKYNLWDTRGLGEARSIFQAFFGGGSEKDLKKFLKERHLSCQIDLLVYCVRASRATEASVKYYHNFCAITRRLVAPVAVVVTHLEREVRDMEDWWERNAPGFETLNMNFDDHACVTAHPEHPRRIESKKRLSDLITRRRFWEAQGSEPYFGSPVQKPTPLASPHHDGWMLWNLFKTKYENSVDEGDPHPRLRIDSNPSTVASIGNSSYHTAKSTESVPPSPVVEPPTPLSKTPSISVPRIETSFLRAGDLSQSPSEDTSSVRSSLQSILYASSHSSSSSYFDVRLQSCTEDNEGLPLNPPKDCAPIVDHSNKLSFTHSTAIVRRRQGYAVERGFFGDVWKCDLNSGGSTRIVIRVHAKQGNQVAVKAIKPNPEDPSSHEKKLHRELRVWGRLQHKNVVPLLGVVSDFGPLPSMVSPWFSNGSLSSYLTANQTLKLSQRHHLLKDIASGLCYLHDQGVIHGDLHSGNILIDDNGTACLTDFGLSLVGEFVGTSYLRSSICGKVQFADPALVQRVNNSERVVYPTKPCDIYSFGGLMLHILSGKKPYNGIYPAAILLTVLKGERPQIPSHDNNITRGHESVIQRCWDQEESKRPSADDLARFDW